MTEKKKRGRPPKIKTEIGPFNPDKLQEEVDKVFPKTDSQIKQESVEKYDQEQSKIPINDEPAKYQTTPMSTWAQENRKRKLGLKD
jgi:hypothetical protein